MEKITKITEDLSMYGENAFEKTESIYGNALIKYSDGTVKCFYKNTVHELKDYDKTVTMEQFASVLMENIDNLNGVIRGFNGDMNNLVTQFLNPMNGNMLAVVNILERKGIITKEEMNEELKAIGREREQELAKLQVEQSIRSALTVNELELSILTNNKTDEATLADVEKGKLFIEQTDLQHKEFKEYNEVREIGKYINSKIKVMLEDNSNKKIIPVRDVQKAINPNLAEKYIAYLGKVGINELNKLSKGDMYII